MSGSAGSGSVVTAQETYGAIGFTQIIFTGLPFIIAIMIIFWHFEEKWRIEQAFLQVYDYIGKSNGEKVKCRRYDDWYNSDIPVTPHDRDPVYGGFLKILEGPNRGKFVDVRFKGFSPLDMLSKPILEYVSREKMVKSRFHTYQLNLSLIGNCIDDRVTTQRVIPPENYMTQVTKAFLILISLITLGIPYIIWWFRRRKVKETIIGSCKYWLIASYPTKRTIPGYYIKYIESKTVRRRLRKRLIHETMEEYVSKSDLTEIIKNENNQIITVSSKYENGEDILIELLDTDDEYLVTGQTTRMAPGYKIYYRRLIINDETRDIEPAEELKEAIVSISEYTRMINNDTIQIVGATTLDKHGAPITIYNNYSTVRESLSSKDLVRDMVVDLIIENSELENELRELQIENGFLQRHVSQSKNMAAREFINIRKQNDRHTALIAWDTNEWMSQTFGLNNPALIGQYTQAHEDIRADYGNIRMDMIVRQCLELKNKGVLSRLHIKRLANTLGITPEELELEIQNAEEEED